jgi:putative peptidoglycan lipid II flippase
LGTALGAWINVGVLTWIGSRRALLTMDAAFRRSLLPVLFATVAAGAGAYVGSFALQHADVPFRSELNLLLAMVLGGGAYGAVVLAFRRALPLGRLAG